MDDDYKGEMPEGNGSPDGKEPAGNGQPTSGQPVSGQPTNGQPVSGQPTNGQPVSGQLTSGQPVSNQPGGYYQNYYSPQWPPQTPGGWNAYGAPPASGMSAPKKKKRSGWRALAVVLMVICLLAGVAAGTFFLAPLLTQWKSIAINNNTEPLPDENSQETVPALTSKPEASSSAPVQQFEGEAPDIGGTAPNIDQSDNPIVQIAKQVGPAVVGVTVSVDKQIMGQTDTKETESGYGTGIIIREDGYIMTNNHVVAGSDSVKVTLYDGTEYPATVIGTDVATDLALMKIDAKGLTAAALGNSDAIEVGETVVAIGNPLGSDLAGSVTAGIISALGREITTKGYSQKYIQTDAAINPGNSGGALVNTRGEVIGINTLKSYLAGYDDYGVPIGTEGIGFAIPVNSAVPIIEQLLTTGSVERPGIGISCIATEDYTYNQTETPDGVIVVEVVEGGPADRAGLQNGDIITAVDGTNVTTVEDLTNAIKSHGIDEKIELKVWRSGQEYSATVTVGDLNQMD